MSPSAPFRSQNIFVDADPFHLNPPSVQSRDDAEAGDGGETSQYLVQTDGLGKRYGDFDALIRCSIAIREREIFGLLGPNGAGKTTLIRLLLGYLHPSSGACRIGGVSPTEDGIGVREQVAYLPGDARLPRHMRGKGVLRFFAEMHPAGDLGRSTVVAEKLDLNLKVRVAFMSTGMRQKLALAVVLGLRTPLLILDEPTANLDPTVRATVLDLVRTARAEGRTVVFSSHVLSEIEETCDRVAFLRSGQLAHELSISDLYQRHRITAARPAVEIEVPDRFRDRVKVVAAESGFGEAIHIDTEGDLGTLLAWVDSLGLQRVRIEPLGLRAVYDAVHHGETLTV